MKKTKSLGPLWGPTSSWLLGPLWALRPCDTRPHPSRANTITLVSTLVQLITAWHQQTTHLYISHLNMNIFIGLCCGAAF